MRIVPLRRAFALACVALALGCAPMRTLVASPPDYAAYRAVRIAPTLERRLAAAWTYVGRFPDGAFAVEVHGWFDRAEPLYYDVKRGSAAGLEAYLRTLPSGPHAAVALRDLTSLRSRRTREEEFSRVAASAHARVDHAAEERANARATVGRWVDVFLEPKVWMAPLAEASRELIVPWSLGLPVPVCRPASEPGYRSCSKLVELPFVVISDGKPDRRQVTLELVVTEDASGRPLEVTLSGPDLFVRLEETYSVRALESDQAARRIDAIARSVGLVTDAFRHRVGQAESCKRPAVAPTVLDLSCRGLRVVVRAGDGASTDDTIVIRRVD